MPIENTCCFFGHRTINETEELKSKLIETIEKLIVEKQVDTFLFGSKSRFNSLCQETVTELKEKYPHIKRIYVRAEYPNILFAKDGEIFNIEDTKHLVSGGAYSVDKFYRLSRGYGWWED